jgi:hypothetical protein
VESSTKIFFDPHDSKREEKILSSSDFVTAAGMVQEAAKLDHSINVLQRNFAGDLQLRRGCRKEGRLPDWLASFILLIRPAAIIAPTN